MFTEEQIETYKDKCGCKCPYCNAWLPPNSRFIDKEADGDICKILVECSNCNKAYYEQYKLVIIIDIEEELFTQLS